MSSIKRPVEMKCDTIFCRPISSRMLNSLTVACTNGTLVTYSGLIEMEQQTFV